MKLFARKPKPTAADILALLNADTSAMLAATAAKLAK
jgi:hypothetical protein